MEQGKEITKSEQDRTPAHLIEIALDKGANLDLLAKALLIEERVDANNARKTYNVAMAEVHKKMPSVRETADNKQTSSKYALLDSVVNEAKPIYAGEGFAVTFYEGDKIDGHVRVCVDITHSAGHKETYHYDVPLDGKGMKGNVNMTVIHAKASSVSYGRRYLLCMIFNIATGDDDGNGATPVECITDEQVSELTDYVTSKGADMAKFCNWLKIKDLTQLPKDKYQQALAAIQAKKDK